MSTEDQIQIRVHGDASLPALIYLPGIHGDWTLVSSFRERMKPRVRFVEFTYPRTLTWSLADYGRAVLDALVAHDIQEGVLLGESFGSQVAWEVLRQCATGRKSGPPESTAGSGDGKVAVPFAAAGLILAGGFGRYPYLPLVDFARAVWALTPSRLVGWFFHGYAVFARWRHRHAPETAAAIAEFVARRTEVDLAAMGHRLKLIRDHDPAELVRRLATPVFQLTGFWDPIVFRPPTRRWLKEHCRDYREHRVVGWADHNVLGTAPDEAAAVVSRWLVAMSDRRGGGG